MHGYQPEENERLRDQAATLADLLHRGTAYPSGATVLEAGCGVGAQTITLAKRSPDARITSIDVSAASLADARRRGDHRVHQARLGIHVDVGSRRTAHGSARWQATTA